MNSKEIRKKYIEFFESKAHKYIKSSPIVVKDDPTLMFTNAGMNQFKDFFLGNKISENPRVVNSQKCLRVSGKHNDLEEVGIDTYHHTMFEMLGNWSFGEYFKQEAISWAWELLTEVYKLDKNRLYVTIFEGDKADNLQEDTEALNIWKSYISEDRIIKANKKDNFWEMGDTGPCGPCSEIHIDLRDEHESKQTPGRDLVNKDNPRVVEIWNLVFIQFNRKKDGSLEELPAKHIDTGMGFERLSMALQGKQSNYDTDVFTPLIKKVEQESGFVYGKDEKTDIAMRVIVDHVRAVAFAIADGQLPSNNKAGYVIRRILRRAVRYGYSFLNKKEPFIFELVDVLAVQFEDFFTEISDQKEFIKKVIREEEVNFLKTLENGLKKLENINKEIDGKTAFELYDTYGFPLDLTQLLAREKNVSVDIIGFDAEMQKQKERSRSAAQEDKSDWVEIHKDDKEEFVGYDYLETQIKITRYREVEVKGKKQYHLVFNVTPFYAESGGQVGDRGLIEVGGEKTYILDTKKENDVFIHITDTLPKHNDLVFNAFVDKNKRSLTEKNHSATHLLHAALKEVLGHHVQQKGSLVNEKQLRFDFAHFQKLTDEELEKVETIVNRKIREGIALDEKRNVPLTKAQEMGATALFGEKYGDTVRVIAFDSKFSMELCGGTHVKSTSEIGMLKITAETAVAAGVRRIEAVTSESAEAYFREELHVLNQIRDLLKNPKDLVKTIESLQNDNNSLKKDIEKLENDQAMELVQLLKREIKNENGINTLVKRVNIPSANAFKQVAFELRKDIDNLYLVLATEIKDKPQIAVMLSDSLVTKGFNANAIIKELSVFIKGGGGGQPFYATAGGIDLSGLDKVVAQAKEMTKAIS